MNTEEPDYWQPFQSFRSLANAEGVLLKLQGEGFDAKIEYSNDALGALYQDNIHVYVRHSQLEDLQNFWEKKTL